VLHQWKQYARTFKKQAFVLYLVYKDPRVPWYARIFAACVVAYAFSPIDLIPDFIPILGYLDDLVLVPLGIWLALKMIPAQVVRESQQQAEARMQQGKPLNRVAAICIIGIWITLAACGIVWAIRLFQ
jgi:uncharacterized membrane protein YkvA (DUF1232 family)